jgi:hypothetical protein
MVRGLDGSLRGPSGGPRARPTLPRRVEASQALHPCSTREGALRGRGTHRSIACDRAPTLWLSVQF